MHLKTLTLVGFKSFADRTRLDCEPGVTVVVGPNGAGKSNLVDAVAWVMGTQATRVLRTDRMGDVIFAGTATRPALGRSEVSLTFDNADGRLPLDLAEVTLTRRLYRDGTSEYAINGTTCRLLDIQDLLSDSGVGRHQHIIVGQGRVDAILNAGPEEHRAVIEEAAGVIKHRLRRDRSLRRLDATEIDVQRLQDLLGEQQRLMRPLKRQANAAERYESLKDEWRSLRLWIGGEQLRTVRGRLGEITAIQTEQNGIVESSSEELARVDASLTALQRSTGEIGRALERDTSAAARLETVGERLQRIAMVSRERRTGLEGRLEGAGRRRRDLEEERDDLRNQIAATQQEEEAGRAAAERHEVSMQALADEERSLAEQGRLPAEGVAATLRGDLAALEAAAQRDRGELAAVEERRADVTAHLAEDRAERERLLAEVKAADAETGPAAEAHRAAEERRRAEEDTLDEARNALAEARTDAASAATRVEALEAAIAGMGDPEARKRAERLPGVLGGVVSRLDVPSEIAAAVDAALAGWGDAYALADPSGVPDAASALKSAGLGGPAFVAPVATEVPAREVARENGVAALADSLGPAADRALAATFLGDVVLVEGWSAAWSLVRRNPAVRAVTPEGDLIAAFGVRAAHPEGAGPAALEAAGVAVERAETESARASSRFNAARRAFEGARSAEQEALEAVRVVERRVAAAREGLRRVEMGLEEAQAELVRLDTRRGALATAASTRAERLAGLRPQLAAFEGEEALRHAAWEELTRRREDVAARREAARRSREEAASALAAATERRHLFEQRLDEVHRLTEDLSEHPVQPGEIDHLAEVEERARRGLEAVRAHIEVLRERQRDLRRRAGTDGRKLEEVYARKEELETGLVSARELLGTVAIEAAELRVREESAAEGLRRDVDAPEDEALAAPRPELPEDATTDEHLASLEARLRRIGPINPLAAAEYREMAERAEFLEAQLTDLDESRRELRKVISALDEEIARLFRAAFDDIARHFEENIGLLFPGGKGRLALTDREDPLASGVDIHVQPMGKKIGRMSMLSGGERSLAALAFLFAVFRARPSPFYVLDEVEAALDDANLRRFLRLVETLRDTSQLVIVTHQQQTMEAADLLYGVTMEPGESSRVLARRFSESAQH